MARDLVRLGLDSLALDVYRIGQNMAWRRWTDIAFGLTSDPHELRELLDVPFRTANEFVDTTLAGLTSHMQLVRDELARDFPAERAKIVELLIDGAPIGREHAESRLGYPLDRSHSAAIIGATGSKATTATSTESPRHSAMLPDAHTHWSWLPAPRLAGCG